MATDPLERVLQLVAEGRLSADEAAPILAALDQPGPTAPPPAPERPPEPATPPEAPRADRTIRLEVREHGRSIVNLRLPLAVGRLALDRIPGLSGEQVDRVKEALASGMRGPILEVDDDGDSTVRIVVE